METGKLDAAENLLKKAATDYEATRDRSGVVETAQQQAALHRLQGKPMAATASRPGFHDSGASR